MKGVTKFLLSALAIGLVSLCHPVVAEAKNYIYLEDSPTVNHWYDEQSATPTPLDTLSFADGDNIRIGTAIDDAEFQTILGQIPSTIHIASLSVEEEPLTDLHVSSGNIDTVILYYATAPSSPKPQIHLEQQLHTNTVKLFGGNALLTLPYTLPNLWLGDIDIASYNSMSDLDSNIVLASDVASLSILRPTLTDDYEYGPESVMESDLYINYTGNCLLKKTHSIQQVDIYETYYDGIGDVDVSLPKEYLENVSSPYHNDSDDVLLLQEGLWNSSAVPLTPIANWQSTYNERYQIQYVCYGDTGKGQSWKKEYYASNTLVCSEPLPRGFDPNTIPSNHKIIIEGMDATITGTQGLILTGNWKNVLLRSGKTTIHGNVDHLVLEDCVRFHTDTQTGLTAAIHGDVRELEIINASPYSNLMITGSVTKGMKTAIVQALNSWKYTYFSKENGLNNEVLTCGTMNPTIYLYDTEDKKGIPYQMNTDHLEAESYAGIHDPNEKIDRFNQDAYMNLGETLTETSLSNEEVAAIKEQAFQGIYCDLVITDTVFDLTLQLYYGDKNHIYSNGSDFSREIPVTETTAPLSFTILIPNYIEGHTYRILRMHPDHSTGRMRYDILPCTQDGNKLTFATDKFSKFVVVEGELQEPDPVPTPTPIPTPTPVPTPTPAPTPDPEQTPQATPSPAPQTFKAPQTSDSTRTNFYLWILASGLFLLPLSLRKAAGLITARIRNILVLQWIILFSIFGIQGVNLSRGTFILESERRDSELAVYELSLDWKGIHKEEYWRFDLLDKYTNPQINAYGDDLIVFYQDDKKRLPQVYVEMDSDEDWIDLDCPAKGKHSYLEVDDEYIYVYTKKAVYYCDVEDPLSGWECEELEK